VLFAGTSTGTAAYIALHKNVKPYFALQYMAGFAQFYLTFSQLPSPSLLDRAVRATVGRVGSSGKMPSPQCDREPEA
jgi:hypothetical protein